MRGRGPYLAVLVLGLVVAAVLLWPRLRGPRAGAGPRPAGSALPGSAPAVGAPATSVVAGGGAPAAGTGSAADAPAPAAPAAPSGGETDAGAPCPSGMLLVEGTYCPFVAHFCAVPFGPAGGAEREDEDENAQGMRRCRRYRPELVCEGRPAVLRFCIDRYEYPNIAGARPVVMVDYFQAERACRLEGKRLCEVEEWTFACEGREIWPYPYGLERDAAACNFDRGYRQPDLGAFARPHEVSIEVERLDQRVLSGAPARCTSPFGVHDMTGNVDEWAHDPRGSRHKPPYDTALKGGYWGPIRARCRPQTGSHNGWFRFYQVGFRCCADTLDGRPARELLPRTVRLPRRQRIRAPGD